MAVPTSGSLSMLDMAQEALYATYGTGSVTGPISMYDMINGGNAGGSGNTYPTLNTSCDPHPGTSLSNTSTIDYFDEQVDTGVGNEGIIYIDRGPVYISGSVTNAGVNTVIYTSPCGTDTAAAGTYITTPNTFGCPNNGCGAVLTVNSSGVVTAVACDFCP